MPAALPANCAHTGEMNDIKTYIDIDSAAWVVWSVLADFASYGRWNPMIQGVLGRPAEGRVIQLKLRTDRGGSVSTRPTIVRLRENREMQWVERSLLPGGFFLERRFRIELRSRGVRFHHSIRRGGLLSMLYRSPTASPRKSADAMNSALKHRVEQIVVPGASPAAVH